MNIDQSHLTTVVIHHPVTPNQQTEFVAWQDEVVAEVQKIPGFVSAERIPPVQDAQHDWTVIYRFDSPEAHQRWTDSPERKRLQAKAPQFANYQLREHIGEFGGWIPDTADGPPPKWKSAMAVLTAFYPTALLLSYTIALLLPAIGITTTWVNVLVINGCGVAFLTWVLLPLLLKAIGFWMVPSDKLTTQENLKGVAICLFFWLLTTILFLVLPAPPVIGG